MEKVINENFVKKTLLLAGIFNLIWGLSIIFSPQLAFQLLDISSPNYLEIWQSLGLISAVLGVGFFIASSDPSTHWAIVLVGFLGKLLSLLGFIKSSFFGSMSLKFGWVILVQDLIWVIPFYFILIYIYNFHSSDESDPKKFSDLISIIRTNQGVNLAALSQDQKLLLVFIRHLGCTFCRETVSNIAKLDTSLKGKNLTPVFIHMSDPEYADTFFSNYYQNPVHHISDPQRKLFKSLKIKRGNLWELFGPRVFFRGVWAGFFKGHGIGAIEGDPLQLGGYFVLSKGQILFEHRNTSASDSFELNILPEF